MSHAPAFDLPLRHAGGALARRYFSDTRALQLSSSSPSDDRRS